jgi:putative endonuclease
VAAYLAERGFEIVAVNLRLQYLELDVVARQGELVVVVEVRTRGSGAWTNAFGSIDGRKRQRIRHAGERLWERRYRHDASVKRMRFDAASVGFDADGSPRVEYVAAAF